MASINPLWRGTPEARLGTLLVAANPMTAKSECERIIAEAREETYRELDAKFANRSSSAYDDEWDARFRDRLAAIIQKTEADNGNV